MFFYCIIVDEHINFVERQVLEMSLVEKLDPRLKTIASLVRKGSRVADIGCDHGYLVCALMQDGIVSGAIATDINEKPLMRAASTISQCGLKDKIDCRLGDGLTIVEQQEADDIVIAGMGGELIASILENCGWSDFSNKHFILQPMTRTPHLRRWLCNNGFGITAERACIAGDYPYTVMLVSYTGQRCSLGEFDLYCYSGELTCVHTQEARRYLQRMIKSIRKQRSGIESSDPQRAMQLQRLIDKLITVIQEEL